MGRGTKETKKKGFCSQQRMGEGTETKTEKEEPLPTQNASFNKNKK